MPTATATVAADRPASAPIIVWFRQDLRLADQPALHAAVTQATAGGAAVLPVYIWSPDEEGDWAPGGASRWWLHHSLTALAADLATRGARLLIRRGPAATVLPALAAEVGARAVYWNRRYEPAAIARDAALKTALRAAGVAAESCNGALLREPWTVQTKTGSPYQVFTPYWKTCVALDEPAEPLPAPPRLPAGSDATRRTLADLPGLDVAALGLLPTIPWDGGLAETWTPGEAGAHEALQRFLDEAVLAYPTARDVPATRGTSRLSPYLHTGELSPRQVWHAVRLHSAVHTTPGLVAGAEHYLREIGWREFAHHLLYHFPTTPVAPLREAYAAFPWRDPLADPVAAADLRAWQRGLTGYPLVDAGMRELWHTGWMHNRVRMVVASFLVKDLLLDWRHGAAWFWDTLVDADLANNTLGWQWAGGCGADAAPYFRVFNPTTQSEKFDPHGRYLRRWLPELARLPDRWLHHPAAAPPLDLRAAGVHLGTTYPRPIVDHAAARLRALDALAQL